MNYFLILAGALLVYMSFWFLLSLVKKRNDVADVAWGLGFVLLAWLSLFLSENFQLRTILVTALVSVWGLRLAYHISSRHRGGGEDYRYLNYRKSWGKWFYIRSYFQIYFLQGFFLFLIASPVMIINKFSGASLGLLDLVGALIWIIGFSFESIGDAQLARFIKNPANKGKLMMSGLWKYSRHPNYFGEVVQWWGIWLVALSAPYGVWGIIGPITISYLILKVSGIPMLEEKLAEHPDFKEYKKRVSPFFPLPPKKKH